MKSPGTPVYSSVSSQSATSRKTRSDLNIFHSWMQSLEPPDFRFIEDIPPKDLDHILTQMYQTLRNKNGSDYDPKSIKSIRNSIERHLRQQGYPVSTIHAQQFSLSQEAYKRRVDELTSCALLTQDELLLVKQAVFESSIILSESILSRLLWNNSFHFPDSLKTKADHFNLFWGDIKLITNPSGDECLQLTAEISSKKLGKISVNPSTFQVYADKDDPASCPVLLFKQYRDLRPPETLDSSYKFYLQPSGIDTFSDIGFPLRSIAAALKAFKHQAII